MIAPYQKRDSRYYLEVSLPDDLPQPEDPADALVDIEALHLTMRVDRSDLIVEPESDYVGRHRA